MAVIDHTNGTFFVLLAIFIAFAFAFWLIFRKTSEKTRRIAVAALYIAGFAFFWLYKYWISIDEAYSVITAEAGKGAFSWWSELPLHLCNINLMLLPIAVLSRNRSLLSFVFFMAPFGAIFAMVMPDVGFYGFSLFEPRVFGYFVTHMLILVSSLILGLLDLYRPKFRDIPMTMVYAFGISFIVFGINMLFRATHVNDFANYFYTVVPPDGTPLVFFHKLIPVPYLYMIPVMLFLPVYMALVTLPFHLAAKKKEKEAVPEQTEAKAV